MNRRFILTVLMMLLLSLTALPQSTSSDDNKRPSSYDPSRNRPDSSGRSGFVDFALKQINPNDTDYGCRVDAARKLLIESTVNQSYYWTTVGSLSVLLLTFILLVAEKRKRKRHVLMAARFLTRYHNELVNARTTALEAVVRHDRLKNLLDNSSAPALQREPATVKENSPSLGTAGGAQRVSNAAANHDLVTELNMLRQERPILQNTIKKLRQEANERKQRSQLPRTESSHS